MTDGRSTEWRYFSSREVRAARAWADAGKVAVHENLFRYRGHPTCHLLAKSETLLFQAARLLGCGDEWFHQSRTPHFDLVGIHRKRALIRCGVDPRNDGHRNSAHKAS